MEDACKLDEDCGHPWSHDGEGRDDHLVEDVGDHEGGAHDHRVGEREDEDGGGGGPAESLLQPPLLLFQRYAVRRVS